MRAPGETIDIWVVEKALGSGGMGSVYRCHNRSATRILAAVKVLDIQIRKGSGAEERFIREAEILFRVDHPNVVKVRNIRTDTDPPYLEMEFVEGESLESILGRGPLPVPRALALFGQLADAVAYLHALGIRHRDIKPQNVLVRPDGTVKLVDFGLAMEADASRITQQGTTFGTVSYAPPEWVNETLDPVKWDIYALGVVCWEMLTGDVAFPVSGQGSARQQAMQVMLAKQNHAPLDPGEGFPKALRDLIADLTRSDANVRLRDAGEIVERLRAIDPTLPVAQRAPSGGARREAVTWVDPTGGARIVDGVLIAETPARAATPPETLAAPPTPPRPTRVPPQTQTLSLEPPAAPRRSRAGLWVGAALLVALLTAGVGVVAVAVAALALVPPTAQLRDLDVVVGGLAEGTPVALALDGQAPASQDAWVSRFPAAVVGRHELRAVIGAECQPCLAAGPCPDWCVSSPPTPVDVVAGDGPQSVPIALTPAPKRTVEVQVVGGAPGLRLEVDGADVLLDADQRGTVALAPGKHDAKLATCPSDCPTDGCPPGCAEDFRPIEVGAGPPRPVVIAAPDAWAQVAAPAPTRPVGPKPTPPAAAPKASGAGRLITNAEFAAWLGPRAAEWGRDAAIAAARAEGSYLEGWADLAPPPGKERAAALNVSWYAADAFCRGRGGLANVDAEPLRWDDSQPAFYEWRQTSDGAPMFRGADGTQGLQRTKKSTNSLTGFRCAR